MLTFLSNIGLSLSDNSKAYFLDSVAKDANAGAIKAVASGRDLKVTIDNIDGRLLANQVNLRVFIILKMSLCVLNFSISIQSVVLCEYQ